MQQISRFEQARRVGGIVGVIAFMGLTWLWSGCQARDEGDPCGQIMTKLSSCTPDGQTLHAGICDEALLSGYDHILSASCDTLASSIGKEDSLFGMYFRSFPGGSPFGAPPATASGTSGTTTYGFGQGHPELLNRALAVLKSSPLATILPYNYTLDGCYARALLMGAVLEAQREPIASDALYVFAKNPGFPVRLSSGSTVYWSYHVAPLVTVDGRSYIIDPSVSDTQIVPMSVPNWLAKFTSAGVESVCKSTAVPSSYFLFTDNSVALPNQCVVPTWDYRTVLRRKNYRLGDLAIACQTMYDYATELNRMGANRLFSSSTQTYSVDPNQIPAAVRNLISAFGTRLDRTIGPAKYSESHFGISAFGQTITAVTCGGQSIYPL